MRTLILHILIIILISIVQSKNQDLHVQYYIFKTGIGMNIIMLHISTVQLLE